MIATDPRDIAMQTTVPTLMVPKFGDLPPIEGSGHRYLSAADGLWLEVKRPWLHLVIPVAQQTDYAMPYGELTRKIEFTFGKVPEFLITQFLIDARQDFPNEFGACLIWDDLEGRLKYRAMESIESNPDHLTYRRPDLDEHQSIAIELHSHGGHPAFFSPVDDADDRFEVKVAGVFGSLDLDEVSVEFRLCTGGGFINLGTAGFNGKG